MRNVRFITCSILLCAPWLLPSLGCKKQEAQASAPVDTNAAAAQAPVPAAQPQATSGSAPVFSPSSIPEVQAAIKSRDYDKAAAMLINLQRAPMTSDQSMQVLNQMRQFQQNLAGAVASGDPNAKAAAARLRQSSLH